MNTISAGTSGGISFRLRRIGLFAAAAFVVVTSGAATPPDPVTTEPKSSSSSLPSDPTVWLATHESAYAVDPAANRIFRTLPLPHKPDALAVDSKDGALWVLAHRNLYKFDATTSLILDVDLKEISEKIDPSMLSLDPRDGRVWVAGKRGLLALDRAGNLVFERETADDVRGIALGLDGSIWFFAPKKLSHLSIDGTVLHEVALKKLVKNPRWIAVDSLGAKVWLAGRRELVQFHAKDPTESPKSVVPGSFSDSEPSREDDEDKAVDAADDDDRDDEGDEFDRVHFRGLALDPLSGQVWLASKRELRRFNAAGEELAPAVLPKEFKGSEALAFDHASQSVWLAAKKNLGRFALNGDLLATLSVDHRIRALALAPLGITPRLNLLFPGTGVAMRDARPTIRLRLSASCNDVACAPPESYFDTLKLDVALNGAAVGERFVIADGEATFIPTQRLPEGLNTLTARATDAFGRVSDTVTANFTIDTVVPQFLDVSPADGSFVNQGKITIAGQVDDPSAVVTLKNAAGTLGTGAAKFNFPVTLNAGLNSFDLSAHDGVGNVNTANHRIVLDTVPPAAPRLDLISMTGPSGDVVALTGGVGTVESDARVLITNGRTGVVVEVAATTDGRFDARIGAENGDTLTLVARDRAGNVSASTIVTVGGGTIPPDPAIVASPIDRTVATTTYTSTAFLYTGSNPIQTGVAAGTIEPRRAAVLRGRVSGRDGAPIAGVMIAIHNHPEFGETRTRTDGMFDIAVNGGGTLIVDYRKNDYLPVQRQLHVPWDDFTSVPDVMMIGLDAQVTKIDLGASTMQVARGSISTDLDGTRRATLLVPAGTTATMTLPDGTIRTPTTLNVRATEYTVGQNGPSAMPGTLPATSGYTYAVELSADEAIASNAKSIVFNQPIYQYVENFLDFPVGGVVPAGFYDRDKSAWLPSGDGKVIRVLSTVGGIAQLDTNGDGAVDDAAALAALKITDNERIELAGLYAGGISLWRVPIPHFTPWDYNWPYGPPEDAENPKQPDPDKDDPENDPCTQKGSIIECQNQVLAERIPLVGTPFELNYSSDQVPGRKAFLDVNLSGATIPASLRRIRLLIGIAGQNHAFSFAAAANLKHRFVWDGKDAYGRIVTGSQKATISIGYEYPVVYYSPDDFGQAFGRIGFRRFTTNRASQIITLWQASAHYLRGRSPVLPQLGGWRMTPQHSYNAATQELILGDGTTIRREATSDIIETVAGNGSRFSYDDVPAVRVGLNYPSGIAVGADGSLYIAEVFANRIRRVGPDGIISTFAGTGEAGFSGDGGLATMAALHFPSAVAADSYGNIYVTDNRNHRIRRIGPDGVISTVAGTGQYGFSGDHGQATHARLGYPRGLAVSPDGTVYIADISNRIRRVTPDGTITTFAGTGLRGFSGDGGPATQAQLTAPIGVSLGPDGDLYIADIGNHRIRRVTPDGVINTFAGTGELGFSGDGGPATAALLNEPIGVTVTSNGVVLVTESWNHRVRRIGTDGIITTIAGIEDFGHSDDGRPAAGAELYLPEGIAVGPDGNVYIADSGNVRVRRIQNQPGLNPQDALVPSEDGSLVFHFDAVGRHLRTYQAMTGAALYEFFYDTNGWLTGIEDSGGNRTHIERDGGGIPTAIVAPHGQRTALTLDSNGYLAAVANPSQQSYSMTYTDAGLLTSFSTPNGHTSKFSYDELGRLTKDENAAGGSWSVARATTRLGYETALTSGLNRVTTYAVDRLPTGDRQWRNIGPDGLQAQTLFKRDGTTETIGADGTLTRRLEKPDPRFGMQAPTVDLTVKTPSGITATTATRRTAQLSQRLDPFSLTTQTDTVSVNGKIWTGVYTAATRQHTLTSPAGRQTRTTTDTHGRPTRIDIGGLAPVTYTYDLRGRLTALSQASATDTRTATLTYNAQGHLGSITDALSQVQGFTYDPAGRITQQTLPDGRVIAWSHDANGNIIGLIPPGRPKHTFAYTPVDLEGEYTPPPSAGVTDPKTRYTYNLDKQLTAVTRPNGHTVALTHDSAGRLSTIAIPGRTATYGYHAATGQLVSLNTDQGVHLGYTHDGFLPLTETLSGPVAGTVARTYNNDLNLISLGVNGSHIPFAYDHDGLLTQAGLLTIARHAQNGLLTGTALGATTTTQTYNPFGEVNRFSAKQTGNTILDIHYTRDALGRIASKTETLVGETPATHAYTYDPAGRLTDVKKDGTAQATYTYDTNGNRTGATTPNGTVAATYDDQDRLLTYGNNTYSYTGNGELETKTHGTETTRYTYDALGNLTNVTLPNGTAIEYIVDGRNRRIGKRINGTLAQAFLYQDQLKPIAELDGTGKVVSRFVYADKINVPVYLIKNGTTYRIVSDHLGSPRLIVNTTNGNIEQRIDYDAFGNVTWDSNPGFQPFGFAGGLYDRDTKLTRFGARDYDAEVGRWTAKDPIKFNGGDANLYGYVLGNPINLVDPSGLFNPAKGISALGNAAIAGFSAGSGTLKLAIAAGLSPASATGVGALPPAALAAWGTWNLKSSMSAWQRALQQWSEALCEDSSQATWKNLYGMLPGGAGYDDPDEASGPAAYIQEQGWWKFLGNIGYI